MSARVRIGVDVGGTKTEAVLVDESGEVLQSVRHATGHGADHVVETTIAAIDGLFATGERQPGELDSIGVGIPGTVDTAAGLVSHAMNLGVERLELGAVLAQRFGMPVRVENDVNAAALGAFHLLKQPASSSIAYLNLGTGLAAGLVLRGELWRGSHGSAGEIGHVLVDPAGPLDLDGQRGGLEVVASGSGIARQWGGADENPVVAVFDAADNGDARAIEIRRRLFEGVAASMRILVLTVDVDLVVIGGGLSKLGDRLVDGVTAVIDGWNAASPFIASLDLAGRVRLVPLDSPIAALGAAHLGALDG